MGPSKGGPQKGGGPNLEKVGPRRVELRRVGGPKFRAFFPSSATIFFLLSLSWGPFVEFWWCLKRRGLKCARLEFSGCRVRAPAARSGGAAGVSHDSPRAQTCTFQGSGLQKHQQNSTQGPQERERRMKIVAGGKKKSEILGGPAEGCRAEGCRAEGGSPEGGSPERGSSGRVHRKWGARFRVQFRFLGTKTERAQKQNEERDE